MAFQFSKANAVAVGSFNVYIIQPKWLAEIGLMAKGVKVRMETDFNRPGLRFSSEDSPFSWHIRPDRITLDTEDSSADCGSKLADVLEKLPWTPLLAVGMNTEFKGEVADIDNIPARPDLLHCIPPAGYEFAQRSLHLALKHGDQLVNVQVSDLLTSAEVSVNWHTELKDKSNQSEANLAAQQSCRKFFAAREAGLLLAKKLYGLELTI